MTHNDTDTNLYFGLLMGFDSLLWHLQQVEKAHKDCPGCTLCLDSQSMQYTINIFSDLVSCDAPGEAVHRYHEEIGDTEWLKRMAAAANVNPKTEPVEPAPMPVVVQERPPARTKPYWLAEG